MAAKDVKFHENARHRILAGVERRRHEGGEHPDDHHDDQQFQQREPCAPSRPLAACRVAIHATTSALFPRPIAFAKT